MPSAEKLSQADILVAISDFAELFRGTDGDTAFATFKVGDHQETWPVRSKGFRRWLTGQFFRLQKKAPGGQALADALHVIEAKAQFEGAVHPVHVRVAPGPDGSIVIDLADAEWQVVQISAAGWRPLGEAPVKFRRARGMLALPVPAHGGSLDELRGFLNVRDDAQWALVVGWLIGAVRPDGPYPVLALLGEQGAAKSTMAKVLRRLLDPNAAELRAEPTDPRDVMIAATNSWVVNLDNISRISPWLSDCLCRLATGGGFATRELYTDADETIFEAKRPVILNGIEEVVTRGDLLDRAILLDLPNISEEGRRQEAEFWPAFHAARPRLLGALFDVVIVALRRRPTISLSRLPRMADFAVWVTAAAPALGWPDEHFVQVYGGNRTEAHEVALEAAVIAAPLRQLAGQGDWTGTAAELLKALNGIVDEDTRRAKEWPKAANVLSGALRRISAELRAVGVRVAFRRRSSKRAIIISAGAPRPEGDSTVATVTPQAKSASPQNGHRDDDGDAQGDAPAWVKDGVPMRTSAKCSSGLAGDDGSGGDDETPLRSKDDSEEAEWTA